MKFEIEFDPAAIERLVKETAADGIRDLAANYEQAYAAIGERCGTDVEAIKRQLTELFRSHGGELPEPDLTTHAEAIRSGTRIQFRVDLEGM